MVWAWGLSVSSDGLATAAVAYIGIVNAKPAARIPLESLLEAFKLFIETSRYQTILVQFPGCAFSLRVY